MDGAEDDTAHGAEEPLGVQEAAVHALGIVDVGIFRLLREGVVLQPRQQLEVHGHTLVVHLWGVNMHIVHGGNEQLVAKVDDLCIRTAQLGQIVRNAQHTAVFHSDVAILKNFETIFLFRKENVSLIYFFHS